jgi:hypothetical protein
MYVPVHKAAGPSTNSVDTHSKCATITTCPINYEFGVERQGQVAQLLKTSPWRVQAYGSYPGRSQVVRGFFIQKRMAMTLHDQ